MKLDNDFKVLRTLTETYCEYASDPRNQENRKLHCAVNDLQPIRPIVLIDEVPWHEMNFDGSLTTHCQDPFLQRVETSMRRTMFQWRHFPADMILPPFLGVQKVIETTGIGVEVREETVQSDAANHIVSHRYQGQFETDEDLDQLHCPVICYNEGETLRRRDLLQEAVGDLMPVQITGEATGYSLGCITWDIIATYMGVDDLLYNLIDRPDYMHRLVQKLTDIFLSTVHQYEALNLFDGDALYVHASAATASALKGEDFDPNHITAKNVWGRGLAQILSTVSPQMHEEFDIAYMNKAMEPFGLVYYGCCEPLDQKIDILRQIPHLRKISISPWANAEKAAEAMGRDYVMSAKPNPAALASGALNRQAVSDELRGILRVCEQHHTPCELLLKDISTCGKNAQNLFEWQDIAMSVIHQG